MTIVTMKPSQVAIWTSRDFVAYYMKKWTEFHNKPTFKFANEAWLQYGVHIKRFIGKHDLTNEAYRDFVDWVFAFAKKHHKKTINFLATVDNRMWILYQRTIQKNNPRVIKPMTIREEESYKSALFNNYLLFPMDEE